MHAICTTEKNETCAMCALGDIYYYDKKGEVRLDVEDGADRFKAAFNWYFKGAELDDANCLYNLGQCYHKAIGCEWDFNKAIEMMKKSYRNGNVQAKVMIEKMRMESRVTAIKNSEYYI